MQSQIVKQPYTTPRLTVHGTLEDVTKGNKDYGATDGMTFQGAPIMNVS